MDSIAQMREVLERVLQAGAERLGRESGFVQRERKISAKAFVSGIVMAHLGKGHPSLSEIQRSIAVQGVKVTTQAVAERMNDSAVKLLREVLELGLQEVVRHPQEVGLGTLKGVYLHDSSILSLPLSLVEEWPGCGNQNAPSAGMKLQTVLDYTSGRVQMKLTAARKSDKISALPELEAGALYTTDCGYFSAVRLKQLHALGVHTLNRLPANTHITRDSLQLSPLAWVRRNRVSTRLEAHVVVGDVPVRLLVERVPNAVAIQRQDRAREESKCRSRPSLRLVWNYATLLSW